jgi:hypothetical protein
LRVMTRTSWQKSHCWGSSRTNIVPTDHCTPSPLRLHLCTGILAPVSTNSTQATPRPPAFNFCVRSHHVPRAVRPDSERFRTAPRTSRHVSGTVSLPNRPVRPWEAGNGVV